MDAPGKLLAVWIVLPVAWLAAFPAAAQEEEEAAVISSGSGQAVIISSEGGYGGYDQVITTPSPASPEGSKPKPAEPGRSGEEEKDEGKSGKESGKDEKEEGKEKPGEEAEEPEKPKPIQRPSEPPEPPDPDQLKVRPDENGRIRFNFVGQPWPQVLQWLADISSMSLDWQELPGDYLNLTTRNSYSLDETRDLINRHLLARGYTLLRHGEVLTVVKLEGLNAALVPRVEPEELDDRDLHEFVRVSFPLDWLLAETAAEELKPMLSAYGKLTPLATTNRLEAIDSVRNLLEIRRVLSQEQSAEGEERLVRVFQLQYARADEVRGQLETLLGLETKKTTPAKPTTPEQIRRIQEEAQRRAAEQAKRGGQPVQPAKKQPPVSIVVNSRQNSLVVHAPPDKMAVIEQAIKALDIPTETGDTLLATMTRMQIYRLAAVDPEPLVKTLEELGGLDPRTHLEVDKKNRAIIAYATLADHALIRQIVDKLDGSARKFEVIPLRRLEADYVAGTIEFMMAGEKEDQGQTRRYYYYGYRPDQESEESKDEFRVDADVENNRLLLWANDLEIEEVMNLLVKLGEIPPEGGNPSKLRVIDATWDDDTAAWLERVRRAWSSVAPNPLVMPPGEDPTGTSPADEPSGSPPASPPARGTEEPPASPPPDDRPAGKSPPTQAARRLPHTPPAPVRFAQLAAGPEPAESPPVPANVPAEDRPAVEPDTRADRPGGNPPGPAPIHISRGPDGRLVITSEDTQALDLLQELMEQLAPVREDYRIFQLKYAWAYGVKLTLEDIFQEEDQEDSRPRYPYWYYDYDYYRRNTQGTSRARLSKRKPLKFISDPDSNSILVQNASPSQLAKIEKLIEFYDQPEPKDSQSVRTTEIFTLHYAKAAAVAEAIKDLYRDLLSPNDKALQRGQQERRRETYTFVYDSGDGESTQQTAPRFKGLLSIGIDEMSNTLVVSAPAYLLEEIRPVIEALDKLAQPAADTIQVLQLKPGITGSQLQEQLSGILGTRAVKTSRSSRSRGSRSQQLRSRQSPTRSRSSSRSR